MTWGSLVSKVVCADILLFKCHYVNYANGLQDQLYKHIPWPLYVYIVRYIMQFIKTVSSCIRAIKEKKYKMTPLAATNLPLQSPSCSLRPFPLSNLLISLLPILFFFLVVQLFCAAMLCDTGQLQRKQVHIALLLSAEKSSIRCNGFDSKAPRRCSGLL